MALIAMGKVVACINNQGVGQTQAVTQSQALVTFLWCVTSEVQLTGICIGLLVHTDFGCISIKLSDKGQFSIESAGCILANTDTRFTSKGCALNIAISQTCGCFFGFSITINFGLGISQPDKR
jgi:hypothetical protein